MPVFVERMTVEEFAALPESETAFCELHDGEVVYMSAPKKRHTDVRDNAFQALAPVSRPLGKLSPEIGFQCGRSDLREADLGFCFWERWRAVPDDSWLQGAPDLIIEIMSPSNSKREMIEREKFCLANGCREFWTMYPEERRIRVATLSRIAFYDETDFIECSLFPGCSARVSELFA